MTVKPLDYQIFVENTDSGTIHLIENAVVESKKHERQVDLQAAWEESGDEGLNRGDVVTALTYCGREVTGKLTTRHNTAKADELCITCETNYREDRSAYWNEKRSPY